MKKFPIGALLLLVALAMMFAKVKWGYGFASGL